MWLQADAIKLPTLNSSVVSSPRFFALTHVKQVSSLAAVPSQLLTSSTYTSHSKVLFENELALFRTTQRSHPQ